MHSNVVPCCSRELSFLEFFDLLVLFPGIPDEGSIDDEGPSESGTFNGEAEIAAFAESSDSKMARTERPEFRNLNCGSYCWGLCQKCFLNRNGQYQKVSLE